MADMQANSEKTWDIFCRVIDNYGDIGVCWRLARQLVGEYGFRVRLWVDEPLALHAICPAADPGLTAQWCHGVDIRRWQEDFTVDTPAMVVIEAFACELPNNYLQAMVTAPYKPVWVNLEYLTAESWAEDWHGLSSPHPALPLNKYFFFPGFSERSGGLLREKDLLERRDRDAFAASEDELRISLFCYETAPVAPWLDALATADQACVCFVPPGKPLAAVRAHLGGNGPWRIGQARIEPIPFLALDDYDRLLWSCDINFIRGEDSFVRAQWAGTPFIWQIYRQDEDAHLIKLTAFLDRCCPNGPWRRMHEAWNTGEGVPEAWHDFLANRQGIATKSKAWREQLAALPDLASSLVNFCDKRL